MTEVVSLEKTRRKNRLFKITYTTDVINNERYICDVRVRAIFKKIQNPIFARQISEPNCTLENLKKYDILQA